MTHSWQQLEHEVLQLPPATRLSFIQTLATSLTQSFSPVIIPAPQTDFKTLLFAMPNVGDDADFARVTDEGRYVEELSA
jgi:hypothetical protein